MGFVSYLALVSCTQENWEEELQYFPFGEGCQRESILFQSNLENVLLVFGRYGFAAKFLASNRGVSFKYLSFFFFLKIIVFLIK